MKSKGAVEKLKRAMYVALLLVLTVMSVPCFDTSYSTSFATTTIAANLESNLPGAETGIGRKPQISKTDDMTKAINLDNAKSLTLSQEDQGRSEGTRRLGSRLFGDVAVAHALAQVCFAHTLAAHIFKISENTRRFSVISYLHQSDGKKSALFLI